MIIGVFEALLCSIVIDVADGKFCLDNGNTHGLELEIGHGACGVLSEGLINANGNKNWAKASNKNVRLLSSCL